MLYSSFNLRIFGTQKGMLFICTKEARIVTWLESSLAHIWQTSLKQTQLATDVLDDSLCRHERWPGATSNGGVGLNNDK